MAAQRAKHIVQGSRPFGPSRYTKETTIALDEVLRGEAKYLIGKDGSIVGTFGSRMEPNAPELTHAIDAALK